MENKNPLLEIFKGKIRRIFANGKRVHVARSHSICEIENTIPDIKVGDIVLCNYLHTIKKLFRKAFIFHGTGGHPKENWFPWLKEELMELGFNVLIPQFPKADLPKPENWYPVMDKTIAQFDKNAILIGHSLGGTIALRALEKSKVKINAVFIVAAPVGVLPIKFIEGDKPFLDGGFNWEKIKQNSEKFFIFHSDNDPFVSIGNGEELSKNLGTKLIFIPNAGHFNEKAGYTKFEELLQKIKENLT